MKAATELREAINLTLAEVTRALQPILQGQQSALCR